MEKKIESLLREAEMLEKLAVETENKTLSYRSHAAANRAKIEEFQQIDKVYATYSPCCGILCRGDKTQSPRDMHFSTCGLERGPVWRLIVHPEDQIPTPRTPN